MIERTSPFTPDQIGIEVVRFSSSGIFDTHKDHMVNPYAATLSPKEVQVEGIQYWPQVKERFPGIVLLHERWGLTSQIKEIAKRFACEGYVVLVPNLYVRLGGMVTANAEVADALAERLNVQDAMQDIRACCEFLNANLSEDTDLEYTKRNAHAVVGFGLGGTLAIQFACFRKRLRAAVAFYGRLPESPDMLQQLYCPLLYHEAAEDETVPAETSTQLATLAHDYDKTIDIQTYPACKHGFFDETRPDFYQPDAAQTAFESTIAFLEKYVK